MCSNMSENRFVIVGGLPQCGEDEVYAVLCRELECQGSSSEGMISVELVGHDSALIEFSSHDDAKAALCVNGTLHQGRRLTAVLGNSCPSMSIQKSPPRKTVCRRASPGRSDDPDYVVDLGQSFGELDSSFGDLDPSPSRPRPQSTQGSVLASASAPTPSGLPSSDELARLATERQGARSSSTAMGPWEEEDTLALIHELNLRKHLFCGKSKMPANLWRDVSNAMWLKGHNHSAESCRKRKKNLDIFFEKAHDTKGFIGRRPWVFHAPMKAFMGISEAPAPRPAAAGGEALEDPPNQVENGGDAENNEGDPEVLALLNLYSEFKERFDNPKRPGNKKMAVYYDLAQDMAARYDIVLTGEEVCAKLTSLLKTFKEKQVRAATSGEGAVTWPYYDVMNKIFGADPNFAPPVTASAGIAATYNRSSNKENEGQSPLREDQRGHRAHPRQWTTPLRRRNLSAKSSYRSPLADVKERELELKERFINEFMSYRIDANKRHQELLRAMSRD